MTDFTERLAEHPNDPYLNAIAELFRAMDEMRHFLEDDPILTMTTVALRLIDEQKSLESRSDLPNHKLIMAHYTVDIGELIKAAANLMAQDHHRQLDLRQSALNVLDSQQKSERMRLSLLLKPDKLSVKTSMEF